MSKPDFSERDIDAERILVQQTQWLIERMENVNQGLISRATSLVGFAGIELSLIGQMVVNLRKPPPAPSWTLLHSGLVFVPFALGVGGLLFAIFCLFRAIGLSGNPNIPAIESIVVRLGEIEAKIGNKEVPRNESHQHKIKFPLEQLLFPEKPEDSYNSALLSENEKRLNHYKWGFRSLVFSQGFLGVIVLVIYWR